MKKPMYISKFISQIFLVCAFIFFVFGILSIFGIMEPSATSKIQDSKVFGVIFCIISVVFSLVSMVCQKIGNGKDRLHHYLLKKGRKIKGNVEKIERAAVKFSGRSPYRICYSYSLNGVIWNKKSHLVWDMPSLKAKEKIDIYVDEKGNSTIDF